MRKLITALAAVALTGACHRAPAVRAPAPSPAPVPSSRAPAPDRRPGAAEARYAVDGFLAAAKAQDLQALASYWGTSAGSVRDSDMGRGEMEKREIIMTCYLTHDSRQILGDAPSQGGERVVAVELRLGDLTRTTNFYAVAGPGGRWFVRSFDMEPLTDFCKRR